MVVEQRPLPGRKWEPVPLTGDRERELSQLAARRKRESVWDFEAGLPSRCAAVWDKPRSRYRDWFPVLAVILNSAKETIQPLAEMLRKELKKL